MIKVIFCLKRLPGLSLEKFQRHWLEVHAPLVRKHRKALRIVRYVQIHSKPGEVSGRLKSFRDSPEPYDGVAEIWYESEEALGTLGKDPQARAASLELLEDEKRFVDLSQSPIWIGDEVEILAIDDG